MDAVEASYVGRMLAWFAMEGQAVRITHEVDPESQGPEWRVAWDRGTPIVGAGRSLPEAVMDALRQTGARPP